ncbi:MAG: MFS transporter [Caldilineaceae bacterium]|nr:MFS transporter [Caldilineaceae bacterium]MBP8106981.1 MFS transporter [Caldilineaceae bacterium]MBP8121795.1 MFS transporter [Caldilineaceae bacterium]MBP9072353.1 MFS transporter [Caldilineaceae bacterium]
MSTSVGRSQASNSTTVQADPTFWSRLMHPTFRVASKKKDRGGKAPAWFHAFLPNRIGSGSTISLPAIFITQILGGDVAAVGLASSITSAATVPASAIWGWLSDRYGTRKLYLILGFLGFGIPTLLTGMSTTVLQYIVLSALIGALSVAGTPVSSTLIMDTTPKDEWDENFGRFNQISGWGVVLGRVVGLLCITYGIGFFGNEVTQRGLWFLSGGLSILGVVWAWRMVPEPRMSKPRQPREHDAGVSLRSGFSMVERSRFLPNSLHHLPSLNPFRAGARLAAGVVRLPSRVGRRSVWAMHRGIDALRKPLVAYYFASFFLFTMSVMAYTPFAVWQIQELDNSAGSVFFVGMINSVAAAFSYRWVGNLIGSRGSLRVQMLTISLRICVFGGFALVSLFQLRGVQSLIVLTALQALSGLGWAGIAVAGNSTVAHLAPKGGEGTAVGTYTSFVSIGAIVGALVSGYLVLWVGYAAVFATGAAGIGITVLLLAYIRRHAPTDAALHL